MNELQSLSQIFQNKLFRISDYQRGYAWQDSQLRDFWEDLINLQADRNHYTGLLSMKVLSKDEAKKLDTDDKWLLDSGFRPYHIVDGQQRLTTFVILLNEMVEFIFSHLVFGASCSFSLSNSSDKFSLSLRSGSIPKRLPTDTSSNSAIWMRTSASGTDNPVSLN